MEELIAPDLQVLLMLLKLRDFQLLYCKKKVGFIFIALYIYTFSDTFLYWYYFSFLYSLKGEQEFVYHGDRTRDEIVKFALRVSGPPVQEVTKTQSFDTIKRERDLYFLYVGERSGPLWVK